MSADRRWVPYLRVSTDEQAKHGASLEAQRAATLGMLAARGLAAGDPIEDPGASAGSLDRPGVQRLLADCDAGRVAGIVVWRLDRLTRRLRDLLDLVERLGRSGTAVISCQEMLDTSGPQGRLFLQLLGAFAEFERESLRERVTMAIRHRQSQGGYLSKAPYGLRAVRGPDGVRRLEADPALRLALAPIWASLRDGASLDDIRQHLLAAGATGPGGRGWSRSSLSYLVNNRALVGHIVDFDAWDAGVSALKAKRRPGATGLSQPRSERIWRLHGIAACGRCGSALVGVSSRGRSASYAYLRCSGKIQGRNRCDLKDLPAELYEDAVVETLATEIRHGNALRQSLADLALAAARQHGPLTAERAAAALDRDRLSTQRDRLLDLAQAGDLAAKAAADRLRDLQRQLDAIDLRLADIDGRLSGALIDASTADLIADALSTYDDLPRLPHQTQAEALRSLVGSCRLDWNRVEIDMVLPAQVRREPLQWLRTLDGLRIALAADLAPVRGARGRWMLPAW